MAYDSNKPSNEGFLAEAPQELRNNQEGLRTGQIVDAGTVKGLSPGNAAGQIPINNGTQCTGLNAEKVGGNLPSAFAPATHNHDVATGLINGFMSNTDKQKIDTMASGAEVNQNAFANVLVGSTTIQADSKTDTLELVSGTNISINPDATNDRVTISVTGKVTSAGYADNADTIDGYHATSLWRSDNFDPGSKVSIVSAARPGVTKLYRNDDNSAYNVQTNWDGTYWNLKGYSGDTYHAGCKVSYADSAGRAYPYRADGSILNFYWSGQSGQPTWLWGGNDGINMYVYNPSNFSVDYASRAGSADTLDGYHASQIMGSFDSGHSFATNGWQKLSNGLILQWFKSPTYTTVGSVPSSGTITYPIAFTNTCVFAEGQLIASNTAYLVKNAYNEPLSLTEFDYQIGTYAPNVYQYPMYICGFAIGY